MDSAVIAGLIIFGLFGILAELIDASVKYLGTVSPHEDSQELARLRAAVAYIITEAKND